MLPPGSKRARVCKRDIAEMIHEKEFAASAYQTAHAEGPHSSLNIPSRAERVLLSDLHHGDAAAVLRLFADESVHLVVTSPPYNIAKEYEARVSLEEYIAFHKDIIEQCHRVLTPDGSMCWQVGNYVHGGETVPLDTIVIPLFRSMGMKVRNRIVWTFGHGLHCKSRLSGRHETIVWATMPSEFHKSTHKSDTTKGRRRGN